MIRIAACRLNGRSGHEAGRELLLRLYREETGNDSLPEIQVARRGKPNFGEQRLHFSISHTNRHAFCVLCRSSVGIDAEELDRKVPLKIAPKVLSEMEMEQFWAAKNQKRAFLTFWVLKEAAAKKSGLGLQGFPNQTAFSLDDPRVRQWDGCLIAMITEPDPEGEIFYAF